MAILPTYTLIVVVTDGSAHGQIEQSGSRNSVPLSAAELGDLFLDLAVDGAGNLSRREQQRYVLESIFKAKTDARRNIMRVIT